MEISVGLFIVLIFSVSLVHSQRQIGFISIDCGSSAPFYDDPDTAISYVSDGAYIETGTSFNISAPYQYPNNPILPLPLSDLRSFPIGNKNCYTLNSRAQSNAATFNLLRATFLYGDYDGKNKPPEFDLYLDVNLWTTVKFRNVSEVFTTEIISASSTSSSSVQVCLVNTGLGVPFISALELRPLNSSVYRTEFGGNASLVLFQRLDIGLANGTSGRYMNDVYDRIWSSYFSNRWDPIGSTLDVANYEDGYRVPLEVLKTAAGPRNGTGSLDLEWSSNNTSSMFYVYMHFAELVQLGRNQTRDLAVTWNGAPLVGPLRPSYLVSTTVSNRRALVGDRHRISILRASDSSLPPILNGIEIFMVKLKDQLPTNVDDVQAMSEIKRVYRIGRNWAGDPCGPRNFSWEGLECSHNATLVSPRILSLNLTSSNLTGTIASSISKLSFLEHLDLSNNHLNGPVPEFLKDMRSLKLINLKGNQLSGVVPNALLQRSKDGSLMLSVDSRNLCGPDSCEKKQNNNIIGPVVGSVVSAFVVLIVILIMWKLKRKRQSEMDHKTGGHVAVKKSRFRYAEVVEMTKNFEKKIGKGGFGPVFHGHMKDGTQVAIKMLSSSSSQGPKEFQTEAELLMRIHHKNLVSFIGYCDDGDKLALIYEYMPNGNLKEYLSEKKSLLSWEMRLKIAVDAAQGWCNCFRKDLGLEYLHNGCKPNIVHRDVKTANILLGEKLDAKIADFGLSKVFASDAETHIETVVMGTAGYLDPEYYSSQILNEKSDVFSFGVVLLELITGKPAIIKDEETVHVIQWVRYELEEGDITKIIDQRLAENFDLNSVSKALDVAMACTASTSESRATMGFVLSELKHCLDIVLLKDGQRSTSGTIQNYGSRYSYSNSTPKSSLIYNDFMSMDSMTTPLSR